MPLKLTVGLTRKLGLPGYSCAGAGCHVGLELEQDLLQADPETFQATARAAYAACRRAVDDQLAGFQAKAAPPGPAPDAFNADFRGGKSTDTFRAPGQHRGDHL